MEDWFSVLWAVLCFPLIFFFAGRMVRDLPEEYLARHEQHPGQSSPVGAVQFNLWFASRKNWPYLKRALPRLFYAAALVQAAVGALTVWVWKPSQPMAVTALTALALLGIGLAVLYCGAKRYEKRILSSGLNHAGGESGEDG